MKALQHYPTPIAGLALGIAGIGAYWSAMTGVNGIAFSAAIIALCILLPLIMKFLLHPKCLGADLQHATVGSVVPTLAMALMLISHALLFVSTTVAVSLWLTACSMHVVFMASFFYHRLQERNLNHLVPSWYVPPIGIVVAALSVPVATLNWLAIGFVYFGLLAYVIMLPIMLYRLISGERVEAARQPTLAILAAPPSLVLAGYLTVVTTPNLLVVIALLTIALLMTLLVYLLLTQLLRLPFSPAYSAFTFPLVISATASHKAFVYLSPLLGHNHLSWLSGVSLIEAVIASLVVAYVAFRYVENMDSVARVVI